MAVSRVKRLQSCCSPSKVTDSKAAKGTRLIFARRAPASALQPAPVNPESCIDPHCVRNHLRRHDHGQIGIAGHQVGHDGCVTSAQAADAANGRKPAFCKRTASGPQYAFMILESGRSNYVPGCRL